MTDNIAALGIGNWGTKNTKHAIVRDICAATHTKSLDIFILSIKDLTKVKNSISKLKSHPYLVSPNSRTKAPYIALLEPYIPGIAFNKLSISSLKELIGIVNTCGTEK
jgi:hypothetical protein